MKEIAKYSHCFVCGDQNDYGLQVKFYQTEEGSLAHYTATREFEGYQGIIHGGILASLLDEIMVKAVLIEEVVVTAEMTVRFKKPLRVGDRIELAGKVVGQKGRMYRTEGRVCLENGEEIATATAKYLVVNESMKAELQQSLRD